MPTSLFEETPKEKLKHIVSLYKDQLIDIMRSDASNIEKRERMEWLKEQNVRHEAGPAMANAMLRSFSEGCITSNDKRPKSTTI